MLFAASREDKARKKPQITCEVGGLPVKPTYVYGWRTNLFRSESNLKTGMRRKTCKAYGPTPPALAQQVATMAMKVTAVRPAPYGPIVRHTFSERD